MLLSPADAINYGNAVSTTFMERFPDHGLQSRGQVIFMGVTGSRAYGTARPDSDYDIRGAFINPATELLGCTGFTEEVSVVCPPVHDGVIFSLTKLFRLFMNGNPNVLELLFLPQDCVLASSVAWSRVLGHKQLFLTKQIARSFYGYAIAQHHRMTIADTSTRNLGERRKELIARFGYDVKQAAHVIRLLRMGAEVLSTGDMSVRRSDVAELTAIHTGAHKRNEIDTWIQEEMVKFKAAEAATKLPEDIDRQTINELHVELCRGVIG